MATLEPGKLIDGRYRLLRERAASRYTSTFVINDEKTQTEQLITFIRFANSNADKERSVYKEQIAKAQLFLEPSLARVFNSGEYFEFQFFVTERCEGISLRQYINWCKTQGRQFQRGEVRYVLSSLLKTLLPFEKILVYLKPEHILFSDGGMKITPFNMINLTRAAGLSKIASDGDLPYLSADLFYGWGKHSSMVYSLGTILYELLTLELPRGDFFVFSNIAPSLNDAERAFFMRSLGSFSENRMPTLVEFKQDLPRILPYAKRSLPILLEAGSAEFSVQQEQYFAKFIDAEKATPASDIAKRVEITTEAEEQTPLIDPERDEVTVITTEEQLREGLEIIRRSQRPSGIRSYYVATLFSLIAFVVAGFASWIIGNYYKGVVSTKDEQIRQILQASEEFQKEDIKRIEALQRFRDQKAKNKLEPEAAPVMIALDSSEDSEANEASVDGSDTAPPAEGTSPPDPLIVGNPETSIPVPDQSERVPSGRCPSDAVLLSPLDVCIDVYEYPNVEGEAPINMVTYEEAVNFCQVRKKRLCRKEEWLQACRGVTQSAVYPFGETWQPRACNLKDDDYTHLGLARSGASEQCRTPDGIFDLAGNLAEWIVTKERNGTRLLVKGGSFADAYPYGKCEASAFADPEKKHDTVGFRCCVEAKP